MVQKLATRVVSRAEIRRDLHTPLRRIYKRLEQRVMDKRKIIRELDPFAEGLFCSGQGQEQIFIAAVMLYFFGKDSKDVTLLDLGCGPFPKGNSETYLMKLFREMELKIGEYNGIDICKKKHHLQNGGEGEFYPITAIGPLEVARVMRLLEADLCFGSLEESIEADLVVSSLLMGKPLLETGEYIDPERMMQKLENIMRISGEHVKEDGILLHLAHVDEIQLIAPYLSGEFVERAGFEIINWFAPYLTSGEPVNRPTRNFDCVFDSGIILQKR